MTDIEKFIQLYESVGITLSVESSNKVDDENKYLHMEVNDSNKYIDGYYGFYTEICFDKDGKFVKQYILE